MPSEQELPPTEEDRGHSDGGPSPVVMLLVVLLLVIGSYFLAVKLKNMAHMQDCAMSGRTNCATIMAPSSN